MDEESLFKYHIVRMILEGKTEEAIEELSKKYKVIKPKLRIGKVKGAGKALAMYVPSKNTIFFTKGEYLYNPFVVLHEFYHCIRMFFGKHRGTEKNADRFALEFIKAFYIYSGTKDFKGNKDKK